MAKLVPVYTASSQEEAHIVKARLEVCGIPVLLKYESLGIVGSFTVNGLGQVEVLVPENLAEDARGILVQEE